MLTARGVGSVLTCVIHDLAYNKAHGRHWDWDCGPRLHAYKAELMCGVVRWVACRRVVRRGVVVARLLSRHQNNQVIGT